jgi:hypothetical protein
VNWLLVALVLSNLAWLVAFAVAVRTRKRRSVHIGGPNFVTVEGYSAKQAARLLDLIDEVR